jgi:hypothetical protein
MSGTRFGSTRAPGGFSYCSGWSENRSGDSGFIKDCVQQGWIDVLHSFGDFSGDGPLPSRDLCLRALDILNRDGIKIDTWTDHGNRRNTQNFRLDGADPTRTVYHADETLRYGIRYVWRSDLTSMIGQSGGGARALYSLLPRAVRKLRRMLQGSAPKSSVRELGRSARHVLNNRLMWQHELADGQAVTVFQRIHAAPANVWSAAGPEGLAFDLADSVLEGLIQSHSASIVYVHMYKQPNLPAESVAALRRLAETHRGGRIWVAGTSRLLNHVDLARSITVTVERAEDGAHVVQLHNAARLAPSALSGLSLSCTSDRVRTVKYRDRSLAFTVQPSFGPARFCICIQ